MLLLFVECIDCCWIVCVVNFVSVCFVGVILFGGFGVCVGLFVYVICFVVVLLCGVFVLCWVLGWFGLVVCALCF